MRKIRMKKKILIIVAFLLAILILADWIVAVKMYEDNFGKRFESYKPYMLNVDDFDGLVCESCEFSSDKGQKLAGYLYSNGSEQHGVVVMAHGFGGGGQNYYMDCANYFAVHGYYVFSYDATGNDRSEGKGVGGLPQGVIDLDNAITYVEHNEKLKNLPIVLFGHSWGGYSVSAVLTYHPEVKAVAEASGFNLSSDLVEATGKNMVGNLAYIMIPFVKLHEKIKFGKYASNTALDGFGSSNAAVMIIHSSDDNIVPIEYGYNIYYEKYKNDPRFTFVLFDDKGHGGVYDDIGNKYRKDFYFQVGEWCKTLDYDYKSDENKERFEKEKAEYIKENLDREKWCNKLDTDLFERIVKFFDDNISE